MPNDKSAPSSNRRRNRNLPQQKEINGALIEFQPINELGPSALYYYDDSNNKAHSLYPSIYAMVPDLAGYGFFPIWSFFLEEYYENLGLITIKQFNVWVGIANLRNRGYRIALTKDRRKGKDGEAEVRALDKYLDRDYRLLRDDLDQLEDALLIHRIRRADFRGTPDDIIVHTPFTPQQLYDGGMADKIRDRIDRQVTKNARDDKRVTGVTEDGRNFAYVPRTLDRQHRFTYDRNQVSDAFGQHTTSFAQWALKFFRSNFNFLRTDKQAFDRDYRDELKLELDLYGIKRNDRRELCYRAANKFRQIYCPSMEELLA